MDRSRRSRYRLRSRNRTEPQLACSSPRMARLLRSYSRWLKRSTSLRQSSLRKSRTLVPWHTARQHARCHSERTVPVSCRQTRGAARLLTSLDARGSVDPRPTSSRRNVRGHRSVYWLRSHDRLQDLPEKTVGSRVTSKPQSHRRWKFLSLRQQNRLREQNAHQRRFQSPSQYVRLSESLRAIRQKHALSQQNLADRLGVNKRTIIRWETQSGYLPRPETMKKIRRLK